jgi:hypothetical protein
MSRADAVDDSALNPGQPTEFVDESNLVPESSVFATEGRRAAGAGDSELLGSGATNKAAAKSFIASNLPLVIGAGVALVAVALFVLASNEDVVQVQAAPVAAAAPPGASDQQLAALQAQLRERDTKIGALESSVEQMKASEAEAARAGQEAARTAQEAIEQIETIRREMAESQRKQAAAASAAAQAALDAARRAERPQPAPAGFSLRAVTTGLAWVQLPSGAVVVVGEGAAADAPCIRCLRKQQEKRKRDDGDGGDGNGGGARGD